MSKTSARKTSNNFDYVSHNRKVAKKRGPDWRKKLRTSKLNPSENHTKLKLARLRKDYSQKDMIKLLTNKSHSNYSRVERRQTKISEKEGMRIAKRLNIAFQKLFKRAGRSLTGTDLFLAI